MSIFVIADTHFGETSIIEYEDRPFSTTDEMDALIVANWNKTVRKTDTVIHLGDFGYCNYGEDKEKRIKEMLSLLNGNIELILGNHDIDDMLGKYGDLDNIVDAYRDFGFRQVYKYPVIAEKFFILSHEPLYMNERIPYQNIHGHIHDNAFENKNIYRNVSVEKTDYKPVLIKPNG